MSSKLTKTERDLLDALEKAVSVKEAAINIGQNPAYANQTLYRIRKKKAIATDFLRDLLARERRSKRVAKVLMERA